MGYEMLSDELKEQLKKKMTALKHRPKAEAQDRMNERSERR